MTHVSYGRSMAKQTWVDHRDQFLIYKEEWKMTLFPSAIHCISSHLGSTLCSISSITTQAFCKVRDSLLCCALCCAIDNLDNFIPEHSNNNPHPPELSLTTELAGKTCTSLLYTHEGDLEDIMADEMPQNNINFKKSWKGQIITLGLGDTNDTMTETPRSFNLVFTTPSFFSSSTICKNSRLHKNWLPNCH